jgi:hypothetical protein
MTWLDFANLGSKVSATMLIASGSFFPPRQILLPN